MSMTASQLRGSAIFKAGYAAFMAYEDIFSCQYRSHKDREDWKNGWRAARDANPL